MLTVSDANKEKESILQYPEQDYSRMYFHKIFRYAHITEYLALLDNIKFFLNICPRSTDKEKCMEYWKYLKGYLMGMRYVNKDDCLKDKFNQQTALLSNMTLRGVNDFFFEIKNFCEQTFLPTWLSYWENK